MGFLSQSRRGGEAQRGVGQFGVGFRWRGDFDVQGKGAGVLQNFLAWVRQYSISWLIWLS